MADLARALQDAADEGILTSEQSGALARFLADRGFASMPVASHPEAIFPDLDSPVEPEANVLEESEAPRFVRGFHDILITIGVIAALSGLWGLVNQLGAYLAGPVAALAATLVLAEILIIRQRLALPAFVLSIFFCVTVSAIVVQLFDNPIDERGALGVGVLTFGLPLALIPYYWRYRVPAALAAMIASVAHLAFLLSAVLLQGLMGLEDIFKQEPLQLRLLALIFALGVFAVAMHFDLRDPARVTRRSDVAFWLHLIAAPALLYSVFDIVIHDGSSKGWFQGNIGFSQAIIALVVVAVMMLIGIVIDRRAFVTSGLISLGIAIGVIAREASFDLTQLAALPVFLVGLVVLILGVGWQRLRRIIVSILPGELQRKLPPIR
ncbi:MAG: hypothetical protein R3D32_15095 [Nitratireductor sp.]